LKKIKSPKNEWNISLLFWNEITVNDRFPSLTTVNFNLTILINISLRGTELFFIKFIRSKTRRIRLVSSRLDVTGLNLIFIIEVNLFKGVKYCHSFSRSEIFSLFQKRLYFHSFKLKFRINFRKRPMLDYMNFGRNIPNDV